MSQRVKTRSARGENISSARCASEELPADAARLFLAGAVLFGLAAVVRKAA